MAIYITSLISAWLSALSLGFSFLQILTMQIFFWSPDWWSDAESIKRNIDLLGLLAASADVTTIVAVIVLVYLLFNERPIVWFAVLSAFLFTESLVAWVGLVAPANAVLSSYWVRILPSGLDLIYAQFSVGYSIVTAIKFFGFISLCITLLLPRLRPLPFPLPSH